MLNPTDSLKGLEKSGVQLGQLLICCKVAAVNRVFNELLGVERFYLEKLSFVFT